jgi:hypothetical protein
MSSASFFEKYTMKSHKYESRNDLKDMTPEQIVRLDPNDVGFYIADRPKDNPLTARQTSALNTLLSMKRMEKKLKGISTHDKLASARASTIERFSEVPTKEEAAVIMSATREVAENEALQRRLDALKGYSSTYQTAAQKERARVHDLKTGKGIKSTKKMHKKMHSKSKKRRSTAHKRKGKKMRYTKRR